MRISSSGGLLEAERGHRRGVVLGLTLAELMLLLLFCLLLASAGLLRDRDVKIEEQRKHVATVERQLDELSKSSPGKADLRELSELREEHQRLKEILIQPGVGTGQSDAIPEETWTELELNTQLGEEVREAGYANVIELREMLATVADGSNVVVAAPSPQGHDWPPIITLGNDEFRFVINSAELSNDFRTRLQTEVANQVRDLLNQFGVDVIEVVGHTDEQQIKATRPSNLDRHALEALAGRFPINELVPADNAGLGLARAIAVANALEEVLGQTGVKIIPLSAAQVVLPGDTVSTGLAPDDDKERRRIEIRVRRSNMDAE